MNTSADFVVADIETDPFRPWRKASEQFVPKPFCAGLYDGREHLLFWGEGCIEKLVTEIKRRRTVCYFHNGGNFDFHFLLREIDAPNCRFTIIGGKRIVQIVLPGKDASVLRDSYALVPRPLAAWSKDTFDYALMERKVREKHREKILVYLRNDLSGLHSLVSAARNRNAGDPLTLASASFAKLRETAGEKFQSLPESIDSEYRKFYYAGRVTASTRGLQKGKFDCFDINSAFPHAMLSPHPWGGRFRIQSSRPSRNAGQSFVEITCRAKGCFPMRTPEGVEYPQTKGQFFVTGWEFIEAKKLGLVSEITRQVWHVPLETKDYKAFVLPLYEEKLSAEKSGDAAARLFSKLEMNSAYGKTGQDSRKFKDVIAVRIGHWPKLHSGKRDTSWELSHDDEESGLSFFQRPTHRPGGKPLRFYNVCIAASITGLVRARLLRAVVSNGAIYCDTDSVFVKQGRRKGMEIGSGLGQWKHEFSFDRLWIAGKKFYAGTGRKPGDRKRAWKIASKGVRLEPEQIVRVSLGKVVESRFSAPSFSVLSGTRFVARKSRIRPLPVYSAE